MPKKWTEEMVRKIRELYSQESSSGAPHNSKTIWEDMQGEYGSTFTSKGLSLEKLKSKMNALGLSVTGRSVGAVGTPLIENVNPFKKVKKLGKRKERSNYERYKLGRFYVNHTRDPFFDREVIVIELPSITPIEWDVKEEGGNKFLEISDKPILFDENMYNALYHPPGRAPFDKFKGAQKKFQDTNTLSIKERVYLNDNADILRKTEKKICNDKAVKITVPWTTTRGKQKLKSGSVPKNPFFPKSNEEKLKEENQKLRQALRNIQRQDQREREQEGENDGPQNSTGDQ